MSPKEPLPIFRPNRYLFPTLSSMAAAGPARSCPPGRFLGLSSGRRRRCCRYCGSGCRLRPPTAPLSPSPSGSPAAPSASIRGRWGSPSAAAPAPGPAGPARPLPVADGLGSSGPKSPFSCLKEPPPSRCDVTSPSNPAGRGRAAGGGAGAGPGRARLRDLQTRDAWAISLLSWIPLCAAARRTAESTRPLPACGLDVCLRGGLGSQRLLATDPEQGRGQHPLQKGLGAKPIPPGPGNPSSGSPGRRPSPLGRRPEAVTGSGPQGTQACTAPSWEVYCAGPGLAA